MFTRIVVGVGGSEESHDALRLAQRLAAVEGSEVIIVHVYPSDAFEGAIAVASGDRSLRDGAEELLATVAEYGPPGAETVAESGSSPARVLQHIAEAREADLLVVGSSHHGTLGRVLLGDNARQALHHASCSVAVAPRGYATHSGAIATIGVGFDGSPEAQSALAAAEELALMTGGRVHAVAALAVPFEGVLPYAYPYPVDWSSYYETTEKRLRGELESAIGRLRVPASADVQQGTPEEVLEGLSADSDVLVVGSRRWGPVRRLLLGSTSTSLVGKAHCPLLILPRPDARARE